MAEFSKLIITKKGQALIAKIIAGQGAVEFTKIASSSASYNMEKLEELTVLDRMEQTSKISNITRTNEAAIKAEASFTNTDLTAGYYMRCLGLFSVDPEEGEILYAVTIETSGNCYMPPYNGVTVSGAYIQLVTSVGNAENVSLEIDPAAIATIGNIQELRDKMENQNTVNEVRFTEIQNHMIDKNNPHQLTKEQIGLGEVENTADLNKPVSTATQEAMETAYISNKEYVDTKVAALVNGAPEALDTLLELASAVSSNQELVDTLAEAIGKKATQTDFDSHKTNNTVHVTAVERTKWNTVDTIGNKANQTDFDSHKNNSTVHVTAAERTKWNTVDTIGNKANQTDFDSHKNNSTVHVTAAERTKWNTVDTALSGTSLNPVQNKVVKTAFDQQNTKNGGFESSISQINSNLGTLTTNGTVTKFTPQADGLYATYKVGADTVTKKLGSEVISLKQITNSGTYDVKTVCNEWRTLTNANFIIEYIYNSMNGYASNAGSGSHSAGSGQIKQYNATTGILTFGASYMEACGHNSSDGNNKGASSTITTKAWLVLM